MDILFIIMVVLISLIVGWSLRDAVMKRSVETFMQQLKAESIEDDCPPDYMRISIEKIDNMFYAYEEKTKLFLAKASDRSSLETNLKSRFPDKKFGCREENLIEMGFKL